MIRYKKTKFYIIKRQRNISYVVYTHTIRTIKIEFFNKILFDKEFSRYTLFYDTLFTAIWAYIIISIYNQFLTFQDTPIFKYSNKDVTILSENGLGMLFFKLITLLIIIFGIVL